MNPSVFNHCIAVIAANLMLATSAVSAAKLPDAAELTAMSARYAPVDIEVDLTGMPDHERAALADLVHAAQIMDGLFLRQVSPDNEAVLLNLLANSSELGRRRLDYFLLNKGPWSRLDRDQPFVPGVGMKPDAANFYPMDATKQSLESWFASLSPARRELATGFYSTTRRDPAGNLLAVPYSVEYQGELQRAAVYLRSAAQVTRQPTLKDFLLKRAQSFASNDYYASDMAWMALDSTIEPTIGPYEVYEDGLFNFKAAFEAFISVTDAEESAKLASFSGKLQSLEDRLPIEPKFRSKLGAAAQGASASIKVVNVIFCAGDGNRGVQTAAYNLPNDERVVAAKGSKRVMLKNFQRAKFERVLLPISRLVLTEPDQALVRFEPFFSHILMHELMHGLGPQTITVRGRPSTVRQELKELSGPLEEAKADISGLWALQQLIDDGALPNVDARSIYTTFLASTFRTLRFGLTEAHAKGMALQLNTLMDAGAVSIDRDGRFELNFVKVVPAVTALTHDIMTIQANGDYARAKELSERMMVIRPVVQSVLDRLSAIPVDIRPRFVTAHALLHD